MTSRFLISAASGVAGVLMTAGFAAAQPAGTPLFQRTVARPSSDFRTYVEGELVKVSVPSNWRELPASNAVTFAPEGAYGNAGVKSVFTHGVAIGLARHDSGNLQTATGELIEERILANPLGGQAIRYRKAMIGDRAGLHSIVFTVSEATNEPAQVDVFTTLLRDGTLLYVLAVTPRASASAYAGTFRRIMRSIQIMDCEPCLP